MFRSSIVALLFGAMSLGSGCTGMKRLAIKGEFKKAFSSTMTPGTELVKVAEGLYSYRWLTYRTAFVTTPEGVIVFDPLNDDAAKGLAKAISEVAPNPQIKYVVYSHFHRDHISGGRNLPGEPVIIAHEKAAADIRARNYDDVIAPTEVFSGDAHELTLGGTTLRLIHLPKSHTDGMIMVHLPQRRALYLVDTVWPKQLPPPGAPMSFAGTRKALAQIAAMDFDILIAGHADIGTKDDVTSYAKFLGDLEAEFRAALVTRGMDDLHRQQTFLDGAQSLADVFFDVEDALRPRYGTWANFDTGILPISQVCFWSVLIGD